MVSLYMDVFGLALNDYFLREDNTPILLRNSYDAPEHMSVDIFFREKQEMSEIETKALSLCKGRILDIGAGVGAHALELQKLGKDVTAIEISTVAAGIMQSRGVKKIITGDVFSYQGEKFDTLLLLMNGIGISENIQGLHRFLELAKSMLTPGGQLLFDSSDIKYLYEGDIPIPVANYYGEIKFQYEYKYIRGPWFSWLYVDFKMLTEIANKTGWTTEFIMEDDSDQYLARLVRKES